ncbi:CinA family protein [Microbacterium sp. 179-I 3D4 NHS]|uniref:CinA family protein n=1 Tax=Microbacterium sp. 179-I 3D4 NHS TaxID=3142381 RepID=UPI0039A2D5C4
MADAADATEETEQTGDAEQAVAETEVPEEVLTRLSELAQERGVRLCVVESLTSGRLASTIGAGEGASEWFGGGIVAYQTEEKERILGVTPGLDPTSAECAEQLAEGGRRLFDADLCVATTGVGGPGPENGHPAGTVYLGWSSSDGTGNRMLALSGEPEEIMDAAVAAAVKLLAFHAESLRPVGPLRQS